MTVNVRSVTAKLDADIASYVAKMKLAGKVTDDAFSSVNRTLNRTNRSLEETHGRLGVVSNDLGVVAQRVAPLNSSGNSSIGTLGRNSDRAGASIDKLSGRLRIMTDLVAILGPGLIPIGAIGVPAIAGLGAAAAASALGVITLISSFQGVGGALDAVNKAALEPTTENLMAARDALQQLSPEAARFVREIQDLRPQFDALRDAGAERFFPGLLDAIDRLESRGPVLAEILGDVGGALGQIARDDAADLASKRWDAFFTFLDTEAPATLLRLNDILASTAHGASEVIMALDPGSDDFLGWVGTVADGFDRWASSAKGRQDIAAFLAYARQNGPAVADAFTSIVDAVAQIVQAAGPLGGTVLTALADVADVVANIADSDLGTPFVVGYAALSAYNRALAVTGKLSQTTVGGLVTGQRSVSGIFEKSSASARTFATDLSNVARYGSLATESSARLRSQLVTVGKTGALIGGLAAASSGLADSIGLTNTVSLALMGTIGGPWGAAIGGAIGLVLDLAHSQGQTQAAMDGLTETFNQQTGAITENTRAKVVSTLQDQGLLDNAQTLGLRADLLTEAVMGNASAQVELNAALAGYDVDHTVSQVDDLRKSYSDQEIAAILANRAATGIRDALPGLGKEFSSAQGEARQFAAGMGTTADSLDRGTAAAKTFAQSLADVNRVLSRRAASRDFEQSLDDFAAKLKEIDHVRRLVSRQGVFNRDLQNGRELEATFDAVANSANLYAQTLKRSEKTQFLKQARRDLLDMAHDLGINHAAAVRLADSLIAVGNKNPKPDITVEDGPARKAIAGVGVVLDDLDNQKATPDITVDTHGAAGIISGIANAIAGLHDRDINVTTTYTTLHRNPGNLPAPPGGADGMTVPGPRHPYGDKTLIWAAPGEEVISNRYGQADRFRADRASGHIPGYADGGSVVSTYARTHGDDGVTSLGRAAHHSADELDKSAESQKKERDQRQKGLQHQADQMQAEIDRFRSQLSEIRSSVAGAYQTNIFEATQGFTGIGFTPRQLEAQAQKARNQQLHANIANTKEALRLLRILQDRGLDGPAYYDLAASGDVDTLRAYVHLSKKQLRAYERSYEKAEHLDRQLQNLVGADVKDELKAANHRLDQINAQLHHMEHQNKTNSDDNAHKTADGVNRAATAGHRGRRP